MDPAPLHLTADSRLLFWREGERHPFMDSVRAALRPAAAPRAVYIGAANGDDPAYYAVFEAAMDVLAIAQRHQITSRFTSAERRELECADLVLLAGGEVGAGWAVMAATGMVEVLREVHRAGAVLLGVSAGAVQLGVGTDDARGGLLRTLGLAPWVFDAHDEERDWQRLQRGVRAAGGVPGIGLPWGGGLICGAGGEVTAVRVPAVRFELDGQECVRQELAPAGL